MDQMRPSSLESFAERLNTQPDRLLSTLIELHHLVEAKKLTIAATRAEFDKALAERFLIHGTIDTIFELSAFLRSIPELFVATDGGLTNFPPQGADAPVASKRSVSPKLTKLHLPLSALLNAPELSVATLRGDQPVQSRRLMPQPVNISEILGGDMLASGLWWARPVLEIQPVVRSRGGNEQFVSLLLKLTRRSTPRPVPSWSRALHVELKRGSGERVGEVTLRRQTPYLTLPQVAWNESDEFALEIRVVDE
jgi:hypothetical protein